MSKDYSKDEKTLYFPKSEPTLVTIPKMVFFMIEGAGNPNDNSVFKSHIEVLYKLSYAVKMMPKKHPAPNGYYEYKVYPLEGIWSLNEKAIQKSSFSKDDFVYKLMIRQPEFVTEEVFEFAKTLKKNPLFKDVKRIEIEDGKCLQMMHIGSFDDEIYSFEKMKSYLETHGLERRSLEHREIYLSDFRRVERDKLKTVLRYFLK